MGRLHPFLPYLVSTAILALMAYTEVTKSLGAHPWWAVIVVWRGLPVGLVLAFTLPFTGMAKMPRIILFAAILGIAAAVSSHYHTQFVAAEDADAFLPGRIWFYGWLTMMAALPALITTLLQRK